MEKKLVVCLLQRTTRKLNLTEVGEKYYELCSNAIETLFKADEFIQNTKFEPQGRLRIVASTAIGTDLLYNCVDKFIKKYNKVNVEILLDNRYIDLIDEGIDLAFRAGPLEDSSFKILKIADFSYILCASPIYFEKFAKIENPEDLINHNCILVSGNNKPVKWNFKNISNNEIEIIVSGNIKTNSLEIARQAVLSGQGIAYLPDFIILDYINKNLLKTILTEWSKKRELFIIYPNNQNLSINVKMFIDFVKEEIKK